MRFPFVLSLAGLLACSQEKPAEVAATPPPAAPDTVRPTTSPSPAAAAAWPAAFTPAADRLCPRTSTQAARIYQRPSASAAVFGQLAAGERVTLAARTADGWVGFDPGTAQAANVGVFRLRWVRAAEAFGSPDSCVALPLVTAPPAGCLLMAGRAVPVRAATAATAEVISTIPAGSYAEVLRQVPVGAAQWVEVAVPGRQKPGYVAPDDVNLSGPCK